MSDEYNLDALIRELEEDVDDDVLEGWNQNMGQAISMIEMHRETGVPLRAICKALKSDSLEHGIGKSYSGHRQYWIKRGDAYEWAADYFGTPYGQITRRNKVQLDAAPASK